MSHQKTRLEKKRQMSQPSDFVLVESIRLEGDAVAMEIPKTVRRRWTAYRSGATSTMISIFQMSRPAALPRIHQSPRVARGLGKVLALTALFSMGAMNDLVGLSFVENRKATAVLVLSDAAKPVETLAAEELQHHIFKASGVKLPIAKESQANQLTGDKVYIGATKALEKAGLGKDDLGEFGFAGRLKDGSLYFYGVAGEGEPFQKKGLTKRTPRGALFAVYDFLEHEMGVRWIWPGETGEVIPRKDSIVLDAYERTGVPRFKNTEFRVGSWLRGMEGWTSKAARDQFIADQDQWLLRQRFQKLAPYKSLHAFTTYWREYKDTHPDIFAMLPNGKREPLAEDMRPGSEGRMIAMCVSNPRLHQLIVERWVASVKGKTWFDPNIIDATENDVGGRCVCENCRAWDVPDPGFETSDYWGKGMVNAKTRFLKGPSLTDRYARFHLAIQKLAEEKWRPGVQVIGEAYLNRSAPPKVVKLNDRIIIEYVHWPAFPWSEASGKRIRKEWTEWRKTGATMVLRPNTTRVGHTFPVFYARKLGDEFSYCAENGMTGTDFDSLTGQWATQGPTLYTLGRKHVRPELSTETVLDEFYGAFGPAKEAIERYFRHWEELADRTTDEQLAQYRLEEQDGAGTGKGWIIVADRCFTPEVLAHGHQLLTQAQKAAVGNAEAHARVRILALGLQHAELTLTAITAFKALNRGETEATRKQFSDALKTLFEFRAEHENQLVSNLRALDWEEKEAWGTRAQLRKKGLLE